MKREILFRGKDKATDQWVYGDYTHNEGLNTHYISRNVNNTSRKAWEVDPDTIGQYTGLKDKNGKKIFEGDIVRLGGDFHYFIFNIEYGSFVAASIKGGIGIRLFQRTITNCGYAIIGNIHDNPELLKGGSNEA